MAMLFQGNSINVWLGASVLSSTAPQFLVTGPRGTWSLRPVNAPLAAPSFSLSETAPQVSADFPQVCPGRHSYYRIRLHETLHHVAAQGRAAPLLPLCSV